MQLQTSLPDLPFTNYGRADIRPFSTHSSAKATPRKFPRTDLEMLVPWASFADDIHQAIQSATTRAHLPPAAFNIDGWTRNAFVENEEDIRCHAKHALLTPVEEVLGRLGVNGWFARSGSGSVAIVGDPDFSWVMSVTQRHPKIIVEYKTWWVADLAIANIVAAFEGNGNDALGVQSLHALQQTYGYMTFNNNKYGILTNWRRALFLRRAETLNRKTLEYYLVELEHDQPISMLKAWVGMVLLAENGWFYASPALRQGPPGRNFGTTKTAWAQRKQAIANAGGYHMQPINGSYPCHAIDFCLCRFDLSFARRGANGCVVQAQFQPPSTGRPHLDVFCKVVDILRYPNTANLLDDEARAYASLQDLQGKVIPVLYGFYEVWGMLRFLALEPVGEAISEDEQIDQALRMNMRLALRRIHDAGFIHGDIARRNFCRTGGGQIFLVDLERCRPSGDPSELADEMDEVNVL